MGDPSVSVLGVHFHPHTRKSAAAAIVELARSEGQHYVVKPYSEFIPPAHSDECLRGILNAASLCLADGTGILWAAHYLSGRGSRLRALIDFPLSLGALLVNSPLLRKPLPQAMRGVDFTWEMLGALSDAGLSIFLLGGTREEVEGTATGILQRLPGLDLRGTHPGHFRQRGRENEAVIEAVNSASPHMLLVAMGFPRQERWIAENLGRLKVKVAVAEGGSFSFISGATRRAPSWMRRAGLEWLFRLGRQPKRIRRQAAIPLFLWLVLRERMSRRV